MIREYHAPATVTEAVTIQERFAASAVFLAGGTEVNSGAFRLPAERVISLKHLGLGHIRVTETELVMGACCTVQQLIDSADVPECIKEAGRHIANRNIRNVATIGGQIGCNKSCGNLLPVLVVLEAVADVAQRGASDSIPVRDYLADERRELITDVRIPTSQLCRAIAVERYSRTTNDLSILTAAVALTMADGVVETVHIAAGGVAKHVIRLEAVEEALRGEPLPGRQAVERLVASNVSPIADIRGSVEFKRHLAGVLVAKTVLRAYSRETEERP